MLWNPGGLAAASGSDVAIHHNSWIAGTEQEILTLAYSSGGLGTWGLEANYLDFGSIPGYDVTGASTGTYTANRMGLGLGWGKALFPGLGLGLDVKGQSQTIAGESLSAFSGDLGLRWSPSKSLDFGLAYAGLGTGLGGSSPASSLRLGVSTDIDLGASSSVLLALSGAWQPGGIDRVQAGVEARIYSALFLRGGYQFSMPDAQISGLQGITLGTGFQWSDYRLDYAWEPFGELGNSQRISLSYQFSHDPGASSGYRSAGKPQWRIDGEAAEARGKYGEAARVYSRAVKENKLNGVAWKLLGRVYLRSGHKDYALQCLKQAERLLPGDGEVGQLERQTQGK